MSRKNTIPLLFSYTSPVHVQWVPCDPNEFGLACHPHFLQSWKALVENDVNAWSKLNIMHLMGKK